MKVQIYDSYEEMSSAAAESSINHFNLRNEFLVCPASGDTPTGLFKEWVRRAKAGDFNPHVLSFVGLDEWMGMNGRDKGSCREYLDRQLFHPLQIDERRICFFDGRSDDPLSECEKTDEFIREKGGIDLCVLGLGMNGHIGMNEPGVSPGLHSHVARISEETARIGQKYFTSSQKLELGLSLGIASILASKRIFLLVSGEKKAGALRFLIDSPVSNEFPASFLKSHQDCTIFLDRNAAKYLP